MIWDTANVAVMAIPLTRPRTHYDGEMLKSAGYFGKWHLTGYQSPDGYPGEHGFDEVMTSENRGIGNGDYFYLYKFNPDLEQILPERSM